MLEVRDLKFSYGGVEALRGVSFSAQMGESIAVIGPNGAGKSTLFACMTGSRKGIRGEVKLSGKNVLGRPTNEICAQGISRTFQYPKVFAGLTVLENVMVSAYLHQCTTEKATDTAMNALNRVNLTSKKAHMVDHLSLFERKRLEIAKVLATGANILLLDEVTSGTRAEEMDFMVGIFEGLIKEGKTLLFVEHIMPFVHAVAKRVIVIDRGQKIADGPVKETFALPEVRSAYFGDDYDATG